MAVAVVTAPSGGRIDGKAIQHRMAAEREAKVKAERERIEREDKAKFATAETEAADERAKVKAATGERAKQDAARAESDAKAASKKSASKKAVAKVSAKTKAKSKASGTRADYVFGKRLEDAEFVAEMAAVLREHADWSWSKVLVALREQGIGGGTKRAARLFDEAKAAAGTKVGKAKVRTPKAPGQPKKGGPSKKGAR